MKYLPLTISDLDYGWQISAAMWAVTSPQTQTTRYYAAPRVHPENGQVYLPIPEDDTQPIHPDADLDLLAQALSNISSDSVATITATLEAKRGQSVKVIDLIPADIVLLDEWPVVEEMEP